jgi:hypothetical protein
VLHLFRGPLTNPLGVTVSPNSVWENSAVTFVYWAVTHGLSNKMIGERPSFQIVSLQDLLSACNVIGLGKGAMNIEVITPTGNF